MIFNLLLLSVSTVLGFDETDSGKSCIDCHNSKSPIPTPFSSSDKYIHYPIKIKKCTACHKDSESSAEMISETLCFNCHDVQKFQGKPFRHPGSGGGIYCLSCHNQHSSNFEFLLKGDPIEFCQSCHIYTKKFCLHPVGGEIKDQLKNRILTCTSSCHNVHGSDFPTLMFESNRENCIKCHGVALPKCTN
jgi:predicted CXXCH cytochrome family protein